MSVTVLSGRDSWGSIVIERNFSHVEMTSYQNTVDCGQYGKPFQKSLQKLLPVQGSVG